jgi:prepilin-type processing-associated H-X9-DG protein
VGNVPAGGVFSRGLARDEPQFKQITDGASNTIMLVEVGDPHAVVWTRPDDFSFDPKDPQKGIGSLYEVGFNAAFCDGSVRFISRSIDPKTLAALFTRAGGEAVGPQ